MKKRNLRILLVLLGILFAISFCLICGRLYGFIDPLGLEEYPDVILKKDEYYAFDPQTILQDAVEGKPAQLTLTPGEPEIQPSSDPVVSWNQADYLQVANAVFFSVWGELPVGWKLEQILSQTNCAGMELGFQRISFKFFKIVKDEETKKYMRDSKEIMIIPEKNLIWIYEVEVFPVSPLELMDAGLDVGTIIPAEDALRIAEENGGQTARKRMENCSISVDIIAGANDDNWQVTYTSDYEHFVVEVDEKTGQIR